MKTHSGMTCSITSSPKIARVNVATQIRLRLSQGTPFFSAPEMVLQSGPWTPPLSQLDFTWYSFDVRGRIVRFQTVYVSASEISAYT